MRRLISPTRRWGSDWGGSLYQPSWEAAVKLVLVERQPQRRPRRELLGTWDGPGSMLPTDEEWAAIDLEIEAYFHKPLIDLPELN